MKINYTLTLAILFGTMPFVLAGCLGSSAKAPAAVTAAAATSNTPSFFGKNWLGTDCMDFGNGTYGKVYSIIDGSGNVSAALLIFQNAQCSGSYSMYDFKNNAIDKPKLANSVTLKDDISGLPDGFSIFVVTPVSGPAQYMVTYQTSANEMHEFVNMPEDTFTGSTWQSWVDTDAAFSNWVSDPSAVTSLGNGEGHLNLEAVSDLP